MCLPVLSRRLFTSPTRSLPLKDARRKTEILCAHLKIAGVADQVVRKAFLSPIGDFEDAMTHAAAEASHCRLIVTRNTGDFARGSIRTVLPEVFLEITRRS